MPYRVVGQNCFKRSTTARARVHIPLISLAIPWSRVVDGALAAALALSGNDSLLSIVQMPRGVPVATVAIHNAANAGLLAVRTLGAAESALRRGRESSFSLSSLSSGGGG